MRNCNKCRTILVAGENVEQNRLDRWQYICKSCDGARNAYYRDHGGHERSEGRRTERYDQLAGERGECEDHVANFGERLLYDPERRAIFQWDHRYGRKAYGLPRSAFSRSIETLRLETIKCALVCANCHSLETQRSWHTYERRSTRVYDAQ